MHVLLLYFSATLPSQRVQFILGQEPEIGDDSHEPHEVFCEMEELRKKGDEGEFEWKETARLVQSWLLELKNIILELTSALPGNQLMHL